MKRVTIRNVKDIKSLEFDIPDNKGVYLIAGANGCGKTTLLICLDRICNSIAFAIGFSSTSLWSKVDQYDNALVSYSTGGRTVSYKKRESRWAPTPKKDSAILNDFGFSTSAFIRADAQRIAIKQDDLKPGNMTPADTNVIDALNNIFETDKYERLMCLNTPSGRGRNTVFFYVIQDDNGPSKKYYSEKRFSTGELAMIRLIEKVEQVENGSMILLDEAELALHPRVQVKLLEYLRDKAEQKELWIFISTHSPTMLKETDKEHILLLKRDGNKTNVVTPCYPAQAIGEVDFTRSNIFDYIFFVEDDKAVEILRKITSRYKGINKELNTAIFNIVPVGGFYETARLAVYTARRLFAKSVVKAVVDADAFDDLEKKPKFEKILNAHPDIVKSLSFTPEVWLIDKLERAGEELKNGILKDYCADIDDIIENENYKKCNAKNERKLAKDKYKVVLDILSEINCRNQEIIGSELIGLIIDSLPESEIKSIAGPLF